MSIAGKPIPFLSKTGGDAAPPTDNVDDVVEIKEPEIKDIEKSKKILVIDGLNYIYDQFLTINKQPESRSNEDNIISNYPNIAYVWKAITDLRSKHKKDNIVFVIKNQDGYKLSIYDDRLYKKWARSYKMGIIVCYDIGNNQGAHYLKGRDDKTVCEVYDQYKNGGYDVEIISKDSYNDRAKFGNIPSFKKIKYGNIPFIDV
jgi:hypothetical protein